jgi:hypothetical protein
MFVTYKQGFRHETMNIIYDSCRNVKASSPWMNVILLTGILLRLPASIYGGLTVSGYKYAGLMGKDFTLLCYVSYILWNAY